VTTAAGTFEGLMLDFLAYMELERGVAQNTLQSYRSDLLQFGAFLERHGTSAEDAGPRDVGDFLTGLAAGDDDAPAATATIKRKAAALRSFYRHLRREGVRESDPTAGLSTPRKSQKLPHVLGRAEVQRVLEQ
jgi:integrase/recombinase XerD